MANRNSNYPSNQLKNLPENFCSETVHSLRELTNQGKPESIIELKNRINSYFEFCEQHDFRPGIESLCLALSVSRQTLWKWCNGKGCTGEWTEECRIAKQFILTFLEQATLKGKVNPASSIFYLKNWADYKDSISFDEAIPISSTRQALTAEQLPKLGADKGKEVQGTLFSKSDTKIQKEN